MKKFMNKYIKFALVAAAFALTAAFGGYAHAAPQFGAGASPYLPLVQAQVCGVGGNGCNPSPSAYSTSISGVQPGDNVWIMLYYNNSGTGTATGTKFTLSPQSTGVVNSQTFTGTLSANNAPSVSGSATVNLAQGQTLTYLSAKVYGHNAVLLSSTQGTDIFNGGLNIGDIHDSSDCSSSDIFCHQGVVVVTYKVGQNSVPPPAQTCVVNQFDANPSYVTSGGSSTINWSTSGCVSAIVQGGIVYVNSLNGSQPTGTLTNTTTYTITAYGSNGSPVTRTTTVSVNQAQACNISYFNASPTSVSYGGTTNLTWGTNGATSVSISGLTGSYNYNQSLSGSVTTGPIYGTQSYTITANCQNGYPVTQTISVYANSYSACSINSFYASPTQVTSGSSSTLYWSTTGATSVSISGLNNYYNTQPLSGSAPTGAIYGSQAYTLTAYCQNGGQTQVQSLTVSTQAPVQTTQVYTGAPNLVTQNSARLNGNLVQSGGLATQVYFQWGTTQNYGFTTASQYAGTVNSAPFFNTITGLSANTVYHYRAVATNSSGTFYGDDQSFSTLAATVVVPPTVITTVVAGVGSGSNLVSLAVNDNQQINACVGNIVNYNVTYKNISGHTLNNVVLQVLLPKDVEFQSSNPGIYNAADHSVTLAIGTLIKDQAGSMNITGVVLRSAINRNNVVAQATIAFTNPVNNSQETAIAYGLGNTTNCNSLAGLALFGNGFWPTTLIGWLALILILLLLIYLAILLRRNYRRPVAYVAPNGYNAHANANNGMRNQNMNTAPQPPHYEDMDVPVYNNH